MRKKSFVAPTDREMSCYVHRTIFKSPSVDVKALRCTSPEDGVGFEEEYEASRISIVRSGVFVRIVRGAMLVADGTQVLFVNQGDVHRFVHPIDGGDTCTVLEPSQATLDEMKWPFGGPARFPIDQSPVPARITRRHYRLLERLQCRHRVGDPAAEELVLELCIELVSLAYRGRPVGSVRSSAFVERKRLQIVEQVKLALNARLEHPPMLKELAKTANCSPFHLSRVFRTYAGISMRAYMARLKAVEAARRLLDGATDFTALALELGYYDHSHFTNAFAAAWGLPPSKFRARWHRQTAALARAGVSARSGL